MRARAQGMWVPGEGWAGGGGVRLYADFQIASLDLKVLGHFPLEGMLWAFPEALLSLFQSAEEASFPLHPGRSLRPLLPKCPALFHPWN